MYLGISPEKKGFVYLELVIAQMYDRPSMTLKEAYRAIEHSTKTNACTIDSSIRNVIHSAFDSGKLKRLNTDMRMEIVDTENCPTNKAFVALIIRYLKDCLYDTQIA